MPESPQDPSSRPWFEQPGGIESFGGPMEDEIPDAGSRRDVDPSAPPSSYAPEETLPTVDLYDPSAQAEGATSYGSDGQWGRGPQPPSSSGASSPYGGQWNDGQSYGPGGAASGHYGSAMYPAQSPYGWTPSYMAPEHPQATTVLVLGVLSFVLPVVPFIAWYMGGKAKGEIERGAPYTYSGSLKIGHIIGKVMGIITLASVALSALFMVMMLGLMAF